ncbi:MAG: hypothetical protein DWQ04_33235 [Chloroflexi bacterium]|nr:MAG: hypothetical protein DWQ04_33235 [Chloroflexota bacterium]
MHIDDLDGKFTSINFFAWEADVTILVVDETGVPVVDATVEGGWTVGSASSSSCITNGEGVCTVTQTGLWIWNRSTTFTVEDVLHDVLIYKPEDNADPDGDSDGMAITVNRY